VAQAGVLPASGYLATETGVLVLLRHVTAHVKAQNWLAVGLEFVIVVIGVFMGIEVSNWNEARRDRADERLFLAQLHEDISHAGELSARLRERRLARVVNLIAATDVVFGRSDRQSLTNRECEAIGTSHYFNFVAANFPSLVELTSSGRTAILQNAKLRTALVALEQKRSVLEFLVTVQSAKAADIPLVFPEVISAEAAHDADLGEVIATFQCDLAAMKDDQRFRNALSGNADRYDAFVRDALGPWSTQFDTVHRLVDGELGITDE